MANMWQIAKDIQRSFWDRYELVITRDQAFEVMRSMKSGVAMYRINGSYASMRGTDDIAGASRMGVQYSAYRTFYSTREWNDAVCAGEFGDPNSTYVEYWGNGEYYVEPKYRDETENQ